MIREVDEAIAKEDWRKLANITRDVAKQRLSSVVMGNVPKPKLVEYAMKCYALMNLAWDYIDSALNQCAILKIREVKPLSRTIRELKRDYDRMRARVYSSKYEEVESERALQFEDWFEEDLSKMRNGINFEVSKLKLQPDYRLLVEGVYAAYTICHAVLLYSKWVDVQLVKYGGKYVQYAIVPMEFIKAYELIPHLAGECYVPNLEACKITSSILCQRLKDIPVILE